MAMTLNDLRRLDPKKIGSWPMLPKLGVLFITLVLIIFAGYWFDWQDQIEQIDQEKLKEEGLRKTFLTRRARRSTCRPTRSSWTTSKSSSARC